MSTANIEVKGVGKIMTGPSHGEGWSEIGYDKKRTLRLARWQAAGAWLCFAFATLVTIWIAMIGVVFIWLVTAAYGYYLAIYFHRMSERTKARISGT